MGTVFGDCITLDLPTRGFNSGWKLTLVLDASGTKLARQLTPDWFCDMVRDPKRGGRN